MPHDAFTLCYSITILLGLQERIGSDLSHSHRIPIFFYKRSSIAQCGVLVRHVEANPQEKLAVRRL
jgi:hypothetical protein